MPTLQGYRQFDGLHWETGSVRNYYDYRGVTAPHTGRPYSEAMLLGISGGIVMGYFSFAYKGYDPQARILTRNTFDPLDTLLQRLGVAQNILQTSQPERAVRNLVETLADGVPAIVWADIFSLPYNSLPMDEGMWAMFPLIVYGYEEEANTVCIADRARVPLTITPAELATARGRVKNVKHRLLTLEAPDPDKLPEAVWKGIWDCLKLYTEKPPKGSKNNFGLAAFRYWADLLTKPTQRMSWAKEFPPGEKMYAGLTWAFWDINLFGKNGRAERDTYAEFLDEASLVLDKPALRDTAGIFRDSAQAWDALSQALLPDDVPLFKESRELMLRRRRLFLEQGNAARGEIRQINDRLATIKAAVAADFPLDEAGVAALCANLRDHVLKIHDIEQAAVTTLAAAMTAQPPARPRKV
ncbi:MAG: BtrH N-terminal domain-containing protein [Chloroflexi bacterium]|nr:BtrH N-terminal domain-containing protein [Chloroflexota bacterium]MCI0576969.1 BtrH N-terminal domain-containing protein [Chloroflexota bacterium]MCI0649365.1 BtrH N-terminal domain-containing protein [Chloroflexota bacterium]MCI0729784.1 BtrH N-terminal domain-containing protein [Chloroflexota bacterium]